MVVDGYAVINFIVVSLSGGNFFFFLESDCGLQLLAAIVSSGSLSNYTMRILVG